MLCQLIIKILFRKDVAEMAVVYATLIIKGKKTFTVTKKIVQGKEKNIESLIKTDTAAIESA